ncbi:heterocyst formation ABC transporter subunit HepA [Fischerella thermalis]|uniref:heterocyst formation ABC transporter subunit HepA n=1 Tax=Fischerella thermalis TaxID=372787 RepID=UPI000C7FEE80|nr:heterocyst formation ABC transporter subunit HepA [Fischerella thermalis]MBF1991535.1 ABC transporter ATP-binding protein [Fischerella thermalis M58_A2018_009]MBF2060736.1 ABC transporter ATP-binding protein [Fischerella thermalis M66_A2018_004]MBF2071791.1 ABC transporter ATP-binding protein [Fischerella thermalis M48_A2018_028]PLZ88863.1 ABC transporter ATP-binding protein [Fischerella thermalis CCMEE 5194]
MPRQISLLTRRLVQATSFWKNNRFILREFKHFRRLVIAALVFSFLAATFEGFGLGFLLAFLQSLTSPDAEPVRTGVQWFDVSILGVNASATERLYRISALIIVTTFIRISLSYTAQIFNQFCEVHLADNLCKRIFEQLQAQSLVYFAKKRSGELIDVLTTEILRVRQIFGGLAFLTTRALTLLIYSISLFVLSWQLTVVSFLLFSLIGVAISTLNKRIREISFGISIANSKFTSIALEFINGIRTVQASSTQDFERKRYYQASENVVKAWKKNFLISNIPKPIAEASSTMIMVSMIIFVVTSGFMQIGELLTFFFVLFRIIPIIQDLNGTTAFISSQGGAIDNIQNLLKPDDKVYFQNGKIEFRELQRGIDVVSVDFGYDRENLVLHNITLSIEKGKMTALVGSTGAGKSTLADLIPRFHDPTEGKVLVDGVDVREFEIDSWRRKMAVVSQDTFIFNTSIRNNIAYGTPRATEAEIREAARLANALEFIEEMPEGFDTVLGDRGVRLSGGQRQRIAIARALLRNPQILILDEATSALDSVTERLIQESLEKLSAGRTVIAIAHRLSTIAKADKVVVLEHGRIVEQGKYQDLLEQRGKLWKYHQAQYESNQGSSTT